MANVMMCSNDDDNAAAFMVSNLAGDQLQWVCGYCLGMLGLATMVKIGALTQEQVNALPYIGDSETEPSAGEPADAKPKRARRKTAGKVTDDVGETTPVEQHPCMIRGEGCTGTGTIPAPDVETPGDNDWACEICIARFAPHPSGEW